MKLCGKLPKKLLHYFHSIVKQFEWLYPTLWHYEWGGLKKLYLFRIEKDRFVEIED